MATNAKGSISKNISQKVKSTRPKSQSETPLPHAQAVAARIGVSKGLLCWLIPCVIVLITGATFFPVLNNQFVNLDDRVNLLGNPSYRGLGLAQFRWMFTTFHNSLYRPITWVTFGADYLLWGMEPFGYHLTSLILHCATAVLVYLLAMRLLSLAEPNPPARSELALRVAATFAALVFAIHPLRVEPVAWASARNDVVAGLFFIGAILCYLRAVRIGEPGRVRSWLGSAIVVYALSLFSKPNGIMLPFALLVLDVYPLRRLGGGPGKWFGPAARGIWWEKAPFLLLSFGAGVLALIAKEQSKLLAPLDHYGLIERGMQSICGLAFYLWKTFVPLALSPLYELPVHMEISDGSFLLSGTVVAPLTIALFVFRHRWPVGMASWLCYLVILAPVTGVVQNGPQIAADRYSYLSCLPWAILAGGALLNCWQAWQRGKVGRLSLVLAGGVVGLVIISFAVLSWRQTQVWRDAETLWRHALTVNEKSFFAHQFLGTALFDANRTDDAMGHFRRALEINPSRASAHNNVGNALAHRGDAEGAMKYYLQAIKLDPDSAVAHFNLARLLALKGLESEAIGHYRQALEIKPDHADAHNDLGLLLEMKGDMAAAQSEFQQALRLEPNHDKAFFNLGELLAKQGDLAKATSYYQQAARINPNEAAIQVRLALVLARQGQLESATTHLLSAVKLKPDYAEAHVLLARSLVAQGKKDEAERYYREALRIMKTQSKTTGDDSRNSK
jgi:protein O-mannosyl-transferase